MEKYKNVLRLRRCMLLLLVAFAIGLGIYDVFGATAEVKESGIFGFLCGAATGLGFFALILIMRYSKVLRSEKELQIQYNTENDERMKTIRAKAGMPMLLISSVVMIAVGLMIGYTNAAVFYTLIAVALSQILAACIVKIVYMQIM